MDILEGLNPQQREAAAHDKGPMLVVAGAGTGKTQVITRRIAHLIATGKAKPSGILALTFTERAAREMEERLYDLVGWQSFQVGILTFHAFGSELLGRYSSHIGRSIRGGLINDTQKALLLLQHIGEIELEYYDPGVALSEFIEGVVDYIGALQNADVSVERYAEYVSNLAHQAGAMHPRDVAEQRDLQRLFALYEKVKRETGTYDYHDQMMLPLEILKRCPNIAERLRAEYQYVLVDEYQDTNSVQDKLVREIVGPSGNIFAVGDDDQAIYGFRGADISNILRFSDHFQLKKPVALVHNYRSGQPILDAAYRLIRHNDPERLEAKLGLNKQLKGLDDRAEVECRPYHTAIDEQHAVVEEISRALVAGASAGSIAVLSATHAPLKALAKQLRARGVSYSLATTVSIFEQPELLSLWYLAGWIAGRVDDEAISHVLLGPYFNWPHALYRRVAAEAVEQGKALEEAIRGFEDDEARGVVALLDRWRKDAYTLPMSQLMFAVVFETPVGARWRSEALEHPRMVQVFEDLQRWLEHIQDFEQVSADGTLGRYLATFPKPPELESVSPVGDIDGVALLTVHASKGLEFDTVYLINCTQRSWSKGPAFGRSLPDGLANEQTLSSEHEYRRLFYVAATRAKRKLVVSFATFSQAGSRQMVTPFVQELMGEPLSTSVEQARKSDRLEKSLSKLQQYYPLEKLQSGQRLRFEREDGWMELGVTALAQYEYCPFEFYTNHGLGLITPVGPQLSFGTALHRLFELYYRSQISGLAMSAAEWHEVLDQQWTSRGYERAELAKQDLVLAHRVLDDFLRREDAIKREVVGVEVPVRFELPEYKLRLKGKIDAIFRFGDGLSLRDYKTGRSKTDAERLNKAAKENFQLRTYALAYQLSGAEQIAEVVLDYVVTGVEGVAAYSDLIMKNHRVKLGVLAERIRNHDFSPNDSGMHRCAALAYYGTGERDELAVSLYQDEAVGHEA